MKIKNITGFPDEQKHYAILRKDGGEGRTPADWVRKGFNVARKQIGELNIPRPKLDKKKIEAKLKDMILIFLPRTVLQKAIPAKEIPEVDTGILAAESAERIAEEIIKGKV